MVKPLPKNSIILNGNIEIEVGSLYYIEKPYNTLLNLSKNTEIIVTMPVFISEETNRVLLYTLITKSNDSLLQIVSIDRISASIKIINNATTEIAKIDPNQIAYLFCSVDKDGKVITTIGNENKTLQAICLSCSIDCLPEITMLPLNIRLWDIRSWPYAAVYYKCTYELELKPFQLNDINLYDSWDDSEKIDKCMEEIHKLFSYNAYYYNEVTNRYVDNKRTNEDAKDAERLQYVEGTMNGYEINRRYSNTNTLEYYGYNNECAVVLKRESEIGGLNSINQNKFTELGLLGTIVDTSQLIFNRISELLRSTPPNCGSDVSLVKFLFTYNKNNSNQNLIVTIVLRIKRIAEEPYLCLGALLEGTPHEVKYIYKGTPYNSGSSNAFLESSIIIDCSKNRFIHILTKESLSNIHTIFNLANTSGFEDILCHGDRQNIPNHYTQKYIEDFVDFARNNRI